MSPSHSGSQNAGSTSPHQDSLLSLDGVTADDLVGALLLLIAAPTAYLLAFLLVSIP